MKYTSIAIDGPSGAGKSTLARLLANELGFLYVDTGALYRALGLMAIRADLDPKDTKAIKELLKEAHIEIKHEEGLQATYLNGENVSEKIRTEQVSAYASAVSAIPEVRAFLLGTQRNAALSHNIVMDGRDIGTVILPNADIKIFLTASSDERAMRRYKDNLARGDDTPLEKILEAIVKRDKADQMRQAAPLKVPKGAHVLDTTGQTLEESLEELKKITKGRL